MTRSASGGTLVIGGGFAGGYLARLLGKRGATIVSPENFMLYTPLLPEAAPGRSSRGTSSCRCGYITSGWTARAIRAG